MEKPHSFGELVYWNLRTILFLASILLALECFQEMVILIHGLINQIDDLATYVLALAVIRFSDPHPMAVPHNKKMFPLDLQGLDMQSSQMERWPGAHTDTHLNCLRGLLSREECSRDI